MTNSQERSLDLHLQSSISQCSRQYPCNHCTRRGRPGECVYYTSPGMQEPPALPLQTSNRSEEYKQCGTDQGNGGLDPELSDAVSSLKGAKSPTNTWPASLAEVFGYSEGSNSNTMALLRRVSWTEQHNLKEKRAERVNGLSSTARVTRRRVQKQQGSNRTTRYCY